MWFKIVDREELEKVLSEGAVIYKRRISVMTTTDSKGQKDYRYYVIIPSQIARGMNIKRGEEVYVVIPWNR